MDELLIEHLGYDPLTGEFIWKKKPFMGNVQAGDRAGVIHHKGYRVIVFKRRAYMAHRIAFFICNGRWPVGVIDHINGVRDDNRIINLRDCTQKQNTANQISKNPLGKGVSLIRKTGRYLAQISPDGKKKNLGTFKTPSEAGAAYAAAARKYFGEFARY